jgi:MFS family permease
MWMVFSMVVTPSLHYMAAVASSEGFEAYGVVYGIHNMAWAIGLMAAPAIGGFFLERVGLAALTMDGRRCCSPPAQCFGIRLRA